MAKHDTPKPLPAALPCPFCGIKPKVMLWGSLQTPYAAHPRDACAAGGLIVAVPKWNARLHVDGGGFDALELA